VGQIFVTRRYMRWGSKRLPHEREAMSVQFDSSRNRWVVRWYEAARQRSRRFADASSARAFDAEQRAAKTAARQKSEAALADELAQLRTRVETLEQQLPDDARSSGVSAYATRQGVRWRVAVPQPNGNVTTRRGYRTREAACQARDRLTDLASPGAQVSFARFWRAWLAEKRPYLTDGALEDLETHGRKRLLPHLAHLPVGEITERHVRDWLNEMTAQHEAGAIAAKTINNARAALSGVLGDAVRRELLPRNPCRFVSPLPIEHRELAYLHLSEIDPTSAHAPVTTDHSPNCSSAPAHASPKRSPSPGPTSISTTPPCRFSANAHGTATAPPRPRASARTPS
jgi:hypothetical protein